MGSDTQRDGSYGNHGSIFLTLLQALDRAIILSDVMLCGQIFS